MGKCILCNAEGNDMRTLRISCMYQMDEVIPEIEPKDDIGIWHLTFCKTCRSSMLSSLEQWRLECISRRDIVKDSDGCPEEWYDSPANIPVRVNGATVMMTEEEYQKYMED